MDFKSDDLKAQIESLTKQSAENEALLADFGIRIMELPRGLLIQLYEIGEWSEVTGVREFTMSAMRDFYMSRSEKLITKRMALKKLEIEYAECVQNEITVRERIKQLKKFIESSKGDLRETVDSIHGEPIDGDLNRVIDGTKRENKALGEKMIKLNENAKDNLIEVMKKVKIVEDAQ